MAITRISKSSLYKLIEGKVKEETTCIIKFYSNTCHLCHNLQEYYEQISNDEKYTNVHFFAFNVEDDPSIETRLHFNGVPTISMVKTGTKRPTIRTISDPDPPHKHTWFTTRDIKNFIEEEKS